MYQQVSVKYRLNLTKIENGISQHLTNTLAILPVMLVSKMYQLVSVKFWSKITMLEISVNQYLSAITNTNGYLTNVTNTL